MSTSTTSGTIDGVHVFDLTPYPDERGVFAETFRREWVPGADEMVQANVAHRRAGTLVGLHYHLDQADHWFVAVGLLHAVLHDLRVGSPTEGTTQTVPMGAVPGEPPVLRSLYIPRGVAHGFGAMTDVVLTSLVDRHYDPSDELGVAWNDPAVAADWGVSSPGLSARDRSLPWISDLTDDLRPRYRP